MKKILRFLKNILFPKVYAPYKAYTAHRAAFADGWTEGSITETWMDEDHHLCVRYQSGRWWHYDIDKSGNWMWW